MSVEIRAATVADAPAFRSYLVELWQESLDVIYRRSSPQSLRETEGSIEKLDADSRSVLLLAITENRVVGSLDFHVSAHHQRLHSAGFGMSVAKEFRRQGVGVALVGSMLDHARGKAQVSRVELEVFANNVPAIQLYEKVGFNLEGRKRCAVKIGDSYIDVLVMSLLID